jgi:hypothetical protein
LLEAMGIAPAVLGLALAGCDEAVEADLSDTMSEQAAVPPLPTMSLLFSGAMLETGVYQTVEVNGGPPGETAYVVWGDAQGSGLCPPQLNGGCLDVVNARLAGMGTFDASGFALVDIVVDHEVPAGETLYFQAAASDGSPYLSNVHTDLTFEPVRDCGSLPWLNPQTVYSDFSFLACGPVPANGVCPDYAQASQRQANWLFQYASGQSASAPFGGWSINLWCNETTVEDACCYGLDAFQFAIGRPFTVDGKARLATTTEREGWCSDVVPAVDELPRRVRRRLASEWAKTAEGEHASVASFARFTLQLMQLGAPADLVAESTRAMGDEIRHARDAFAIASTFEGTSLGPSALDTAGAVSDTDDVAELVAAAIREGCVAETIAAAQAAAARDACRDETIRAVLDVVAEDESRHAALAWKFVRWMLAERPELRPVVEATFAEVPEFASEPEDGLAPILRAYGCLPDSDMQQIARDVVRQVVRPCAAALLGGASEVVAAQA